MSVATSNAAAQSKTRPTLPTTSGALAAFLQAELVGSGDVALTHIDNLERAGPGAVTFLRSRKFVELWKKSTAAATLMTRGTVARENLAGKTVLIVADADLAMNIVLELSAPPARQLPAGIHPTAVVEPGATIGRGAVVGARCHVCAGASVGDGTVLTSGVYVGPDAKIGQKCVMHPNVSIMDRCVVGDGCIFHPGVVIGADGFGYRPSPDGRGVQKIPHIGNVVIEQEVEIGANSCVDRAKFGSTLVGAGTKMDNMVQIGHGAKIGRACLFAAQVGIGGSADVGDGVMMGGQSGCKDQIVVGAMTRVAGRGGLISDVGPNQTVGGCPAHDVNDWLRESIVISKLAKRGGGRGK